MHPKDINQNDGGPPGCCPQAWAGTPVHPVLAGADLNVVVQETNVFLYDADNPRAWIEGAAIAVGVGSDEERVAKPTRDE